MIQEHARGTTLTVRAQPGAKKNQLLGVQADALKLSVTAPAQDGRANEALIQLLADLLQLRRSQITLLTGASSRSKVFLLENQTPEAIRLLLQPHLERLA